jgi:hypothetical protein
MSGSVVKSRSSRSVRFALLTCGAALGVAVGVFLILGPCRSIVWHLRQGNQIHFANSTISLPIFWWEQDGFDEGKISIAHAAIAGKSAGEITIFPLAPEKVKVDDKAAADWQQAMLASVIHKEKNTFLPAEIPARDTQVYCVKDTALSTHNLLICRVPGISWGISFEGSVGDEREAESILSTLQISK